MNRQQREQLAAFHLGKVLWDVDMGSYSTLRAGGKAAAFIDVREVDELATLLSWLHVEQIPCRVIGRGSNILVSDQGYSGVILRLAGTLKDIQPPGTEEENKGRVAVWAGAGCSIAGLVSWCSQHGLSGLEFMAGIPGSVGGAVWMNAGAWGKEIGRQLHQLDCVEYSGGLRQVDSSEVVLSYRRLALQSGDLEQMVIARAHFVLQWDDQHKVQDRCRKYITRRKDKQPAGVASAGSFFKNPPGDAAGRLIEAAGLKGVSCGKAMVSPVHANFLVNTGGATATDILTLMEQVQKKVFVRFGVRLEPEVQIFQG